MNLVFYLSITILTSNTMMAETLSEDENKDNTAELANESQNDTLLTNTTDSETKTPRTSPKKMSCLPLKGNLQLNQTVI